MRAFETQFPDSGSHWQKVAESFLDGDATYVDSMGDCNVDLYNLDDPTFNAGAIVDKVTVYAVMRSPNASRRSGFFGLKSGGTVDWGPRIIFCDPTHGLACDTPYTLYSREYTSDPAGGFWTKAAIDALQVGFFADNQTKSGLRASQIYVVVDYSPPPPLEDLTLRPNGQGDTPVGPSGTNHNGVGTCASPEPTNPLSGVPAGNNWDNVNDVTSDGDATYVESGGDDNGELYTLDDVTLNGTPVYGIQVCTVMRSPDSGWRLGYFGLKTNGRENWGGANNNTGACPVTSNLAAPTSVGGAPNRVGWPGVTAYATYCATYTSNPATGLPWTEADIDALQVGFFANNESKSGFRATQIYVVVDITP